MVRRVNNKNQSDPHLAVSRDLSLDEVGVAANRLRDGVREVSEILRSRVGVREKEAMGEKSLHVHEQ